jgi:hypothetical protein
VPTENKSVLIKPCGNYVDASSSSSLACLKEQPGAREGLQHLRLSPEGIKSATIELGRG